MRFLKTRFFRDKTLETKDNVLEQSETVLQETSISEPPDVLYENEAWAPNTELIGLFRKHRINVD